jgi:putative serine protease PepD
MPTGADAGVSSAPAKRRSVLPMIVGVTLVAMVGMVAGLLGGVLGYQLADRNDTPSRQASTMGIEVAEPRAEALPALDVAQVASVIGPSVVAIQAIDGEGGAVGTGVIVTSDGEIVTNAHVVEGATSVNVRLAGETEPRPATVINADKARDLALLRVSATGLPAATFAPSADLRVGDEVVAIGYALDLDGDPSVTRGIVSALDRTLTAGDGVVLTGLVQTDAAISSGNSGGPLVNALGQVVGINTLVADSQTPGRAANNLGFAIKADEVLNGIDRLRDASTETAAGFLGVGLVERSDGGSGAEVVEVAPGSPGEAAGIRVGDSVIRVNDTPIDGRAALIAAIRDFGPGAKVTVELVRDGQTQTVTATLVERPPDS